MDEHEYCVSISDYEEAEYEIARLRAALASAQAWIADGGHAELGSGRDVYLQALEDAARVVDHWTVATRSMPQWGIEKGFIVESIRALAANPAGISDA